MDEILQPPRAPARPPPRRRINFEDPHCRPIHLLYDITASEHESGVFCITPEEDSVINVSDEESCIQISSDTEDECVYNGNKEVIYISLDEEEGEVLEISFTDEEVSSILIDENEDDLNSPSPPNPKRFRFL